MKSIDTLIPDILGLFKDNRVSLDPTGVAGFAAALSGKVGSRLEEVRGRPTLRMSNLGTRCHRQLWYRINHPDWAEPLQPETRVKFLFGDILEEMLLYLAREAGHTVEYEQKEVELFGVKGHIDGTIDGVLVDAKSASTRSFDKFAVGLSPDTDGFGYLTQLDGYLHATKGFLDGKEGAFLVIDKQLGRICLDRHARTNTDYAGVIASTRAAIASDTPPPRGYEAEPDGKSGNMKLGTNCSYCDYKSRCWPGLRTFFYANGPRFLTVVRRQPEVSESTGLGIKAYEAPVIVSEAF